jgi:predicted secreted Zn-dependent protease
MVNSSAGRKPKKVYTLYKRARDNSLPAVEESWKRISAGILSVKQVHTMRMHKKTAMKRLV